MRDAIRTAGPALFRCVDAESHPAGTIAMALRISAEGVEAVELDAFGSDAIEGMVFDATHVMYVPVDDGRTCGWASGGWRVPGPTG